MSKLHFAYGMVSEKEGSLAMTFSFGRGICGEEYGPCVNNWDAVDCKRCLRKGNKKLRVFVPNPLLAPLFEKLDLWITHD